MITVASHQGRTIVGRLERGADLIEGLRAVCAARQIRCGTVTAIGALDSVELTHYDPHLKQYRPARLVAGPLEILSLQGNLSENEGELFAHLHVAVSREGDNGIEVLGGHLVSGQVFSCEFSIVALDDVMLRRSHDRSTGLRLWQQGFEADPPDPDAPKTETPTPQPKPASAPAQASKPTSAPRPGSAAKPDPAPVQAAEPDPEPSNKPLPRPGATATTTWSDVAKASAEAQVSTPRAKLPPKPVPPQPFEDDDEEDDYDDDYIELAPGDIIEHPKFGKCVVERLEGDEEYVHIKLRNRNVVRLSLDIVTLELIGAEDGKQVFKARIER